MDLDDSADVIVVVDVSALTHENISPVEAR
jgi:hypothetical protein